MTSAIQIAEWASYQAFVNCYLNEFDNGEWYRSSVWQQNHSMQGLCHGPWLVELRLNAQSAVIAIDVTFFSLTGHHHLRQAWIQYPGQPWSPLPLLGLLHLLAHEIYHRFEQQTGQDLRQQEIELLARLISSVQLMSSYIAARDGDPLLHSDRFIDIEQSLLFGHWSHPTPKSRQGMHDWQQSMYTPELKGQFQLDWFAAHRDLVIQDSALPESAEAILQAMFRQEETLPTLSDNEVLVPLHPLQAAKLLSENDIQQAIAEGQLRHLGQLGPRFRPTSSVRTLYQPSFHWMLKLSIPVKITNSQRINQTHELRAGVLAARLLEKTAFCKQHPGFNIINDPAFLTLNLPGREDSGFETAIRVNPFPTGEDQGIYCMAALLQDPLPPTMSTLRQLIEGLALSEGRSIKAVSGDWFNLYWNNALAPLIELFDLHGIALEAHLQNSVLDVSSGYPRQYFYRDNQGYYLADSYRQHILSLQPEASQSEELFYDEAMIHDRFGYYLILNQLAGVIHRFGVDGLIGEAELLDIARQRLREQQQNLDGAGARLIHRLLNSDRLPCKSNLLTRVHDVDELTADMEQAVYTSVKNPFFALYPDQKEAARASRSEPATL